MVEKTKDEFKCYEQITKLPGNFRLLQFLGHLFNLFFNSTIDVGIQFEQS